MTRTIRTCGLILIGLGVILAEGLVLAAPAPKAIIITQANSPIEIVGYTAAFQRRSSLGSEGIRHALEFKNRGTQKTVAVRFGLVSFDVFNRFLDKTGGVSLDDLVPNTLPQKGEWVATSYAQFSFLTGLAYVDLVRFEHGTIWQADEATILAEIRKLEKDFDAKLLRESRAPSQ